MLADVLWPAQKAPRVLCSHWPLYRAEWRAGAQSVPHLHSHINNYKNSNMNSQCLIAQMTRKMEESQQKTKRVKLLILKGLKVSHNN